MFWNEGQVYLINVSSGGMLAFLLTFSMDERFHWKKVVVKLEYLGILIIRGESDLGTYLLLR